MSDSGPVEEQSAPAETAAPTLETLKPRTHFKGKVSSVELAGVRVDIGLGVDGLLHISEVRSDGPIARLADVMKEGQEIDVYVARVDVAGKRIALTMHRPPAHGWDNLKIGQKMGYAKVISVTKFGIFVDIDGPKDALLPHEFWKGDNRPRPEDMLDPVWVTQVDEDKNRIGLTMMEPPALPWESIKRGAVMKGKVIKIDRRAAYVEVGAERPGMISMRGFGVEFGSPEDFVEEGEEVEVTVARVDPVRKILDFSMMGMNKEDYALSSGPEESISSMEAALKRAQNSRRGAAPAATPKVAPSQAKKQAAQADAIARTLAMLEKQKAEAAAMDAAKKD